MKPTEQVEILTNANEVTRFSEKLKTSNAYPLRSAKVDILQINIGKKCNLSCKHCHVEAGPDRTELMQRRIFEKCYEILENSDVSTIDITGGSPEMNPHIEWFLEKVQPLNRRLIVRSNLIILKEETILPF